MTNLLLFGCLQCNTPFCTAFYMHIRLVYRKLLKYQPQTVARLLRDKTPVCTCWKKGWWNLQNLFRVFHKVPNGGTYISDKPMGWGLQWMHPEGTNGSAGYWSSLLNDTQYAYAIIHRQGLLVVWAVLLRQANLKECLFTILRDHFALNWILDLMHGTGNLAHCWLCLLELSSHVIYHGGIIIKHSTHYHNWILQGSLTRRLKTIFLYC